MLYFLRKQQTIPNLFKQLKKKITNLCSKFPKTLQVVWLDSPVLPVPFTLTGLPCPSHFSASLIWVLLICIKSLTWSSALQGKIIFIFLSSERILSSTTLFSCYHHNVFVFSANRRNAHRSKWFCSHFDGIINTWALNFICEMLRILPRFGVTSNFILW